MRNLLLLALFTSALARAESIQGVTQITCVDRKTLLTVLGEYGEIPLARGTTNNGALVIYVNPKTGSWTVAELVASGLYCIDATGEGFEAVPEDLRREFLRQQKEVYQ